MRYLFLIFLILAGCFKDSSQVAIINKPVDETQKKSIQKTDELIQKNKPEHLIKALTQADQIHREVWRVISTEKRGLHRSPFGQVLRAFLVEYKTTLSLKSGFKCDKYKIEHLDQTKSYFVSMTCRKSEVFAQIVHLNPQAVSIKFETNALEDTLGLATSLLGQSNTCQLEWNAQGLLIKFSCPGWQQDLKSQIVRLDQYEYLKDGHLISIQGQILENLQPFKKLVIRVPLEGKISVTETLLVAPEEEKPTLPAVLPQTQESAKDQKITDENTRAEDPENVFREEGAPHIRRELSPQNIDPDVMKNRNLMQRLPEPDYIETPPDR